MKTMRELSELAVKAWGVPSLLNQTEEECLELALACRHYQRRHHKKTAYERRNDLIKEVADVAIMLDQMRVMFGDQEIDNAIKEKLLRLEDKIVKALEP